jgi:cobalt-zinc-cadmium efflux system outer membrane protein
MSIWRSPNLGSVAIALALAGCASAPAPDEKSARADMHATGARLLAKEGRPEFPALLPDSPPEQFVLYSVLNHPSVVAAYYDWRASVEDIVTARTLPDPQFVFQADITRTLSSFMPGLMFDFMGSGKLEAMGHEATATSNVARRAYLSAVLNAAAEARKAWIELAYVDEAIRLKEMSVGSLDTSIAIADADYSTSRGMGTLADHVRIANQLAQTRSELGSLADQRTAARARLKSAMGLAPADRDPVWPRAALTPTAIPSAEELWRRASEANPDLGRMRTMVEMAVSGVEVARNAGHPDFTLGAMVDLRTNPTLFRPLATINLPIWREKIAAIIAAAEARRDASEARLSAEQITLAAELAQMLYMVRESDRMIAYIDHDALPSFDRTIATAEAAYQSGAASPGMIPETQLMAFAMRLGRIGALRDRENAVTDLLLLTANTAPAGSPVPETTPHS